MPELSPKREKFCQEYIKTGNATKSAIAAGYAARSAGNQGPRLIESDAIRARLSELTAPALKAVAVSAESLAQDLVSIKERCLESVPVKDKSGIVLGYHLFDADAALGAIKQLGMYTGGFVDRHDHTNAGDSFNSMPNEKLAAFLQAAIAKLNAIK